MPWNRDDDLHLAEMVSDIAKKLARIYLQNLHIDASTDATRRRQTNAPKMRKKVGNGLVHNTHACLADSLLQVLAAKGFVPRRFLEDSSSARGERSKSCIDARQYLNHHEDYRLRPRIRDGFGAFLLGLFSLYISNCAAKFQVGSLHSF